MQYSHINQSAEYYGLSLILGGAEASLWDLANAYSNMANVVSNYSQNSSQYSQDNWEKCDYYFSKTKKPNISLNHEYSIFSASAIFSTFQALLEVNRPETETGWEMFSSSRRIAWKTGTSFGFRDAWAIGVTPEYTVGVWVGNADGEGRPGLIGVSAAAPIMFEIYDKLPVTVWFETPYDDMKLLPVCKESGFISSTVCENVDTILVSAQTNKTGICPFHKIIHLDSTGMYRVNSKCYPQQNMNHKPWFVLPPSWEWYFRTKNPFYRKLPPYSPDCIGVSSIDMMEFLYPGESRNIYVPKDIDERLSEVVFKIVHREPNTKVFWHLDNEFIGTTEHFHEIGIQPEKGKHTMTVVDEYGNSISKRFFIVDKNQK
jgi:penicillin-binding protein 1C